MHRCAQHNRSWNTSGARPAASTSSFPFSCFTFFRFESQSAYDRVYTSARRPCPASINEQPSRQNRAAHTDGKERPGAESRLLQSPRRRRRQVAIPSSSTSSAEWGDQKSRFDTAFHVYITCFITASGFSAKILICLRWPSLVWWHLNPFSSRHCFWHISQYHRSLHRPLALMRLPMAFGVRKPCFGMVRRVYRGRGGLPARLFCVPTADLFSRELRPRGCFHPPGLRLRSSGGLGLAKNASVRHGETRAGP